MDGVRSDAALQPRAASHCPVNIVIPELASRLDAALGNDAWAAGHRAAALAFAAALIDPAGLEEFARSPAAASHADAIAVLGRYLLNRSDTRGYATT